MNNASRMKRPASWWEDNWREGTPLGNDLHGALLYGNMARERVMLTHTRLWREGKAMPVPDVSAALPEMRRLIEEHKIPEADLMIVDALREKGYAPHEACPFPAADITLTLPALGAFSDYERSLDMETAQGFVSYDRGGDIVKRRAFVSRADDVVVIECHRDTQVDIGIHKPDTRHYDPTSLPRNAVTEKKGDFIYFRCEAGGEEHGAVLRLIRGDSLLILARLYTDCGYETQWQKLGEELERLPADYETLLERHIPEHQRLYCRCRLSINDDGGMKEKTNEELIDIAYEKELPNALAERMWDFGRYLFVCATAKGGLPCNLTGLWSGEYRAFWAFNMSNINLEMTYWNVLPGNIGELMEPFFSYFDGAMEDFRENARMMFGCRGIYVPAVTMPGGTRHVCLAPHVTNWTAGAGWIAQHYYDYWLFTGDRDFLEKRALPFMKGAAAFYMDFIQWKGDKWHVYPSVSPENHTLDYRRAGQKSGDMSKAVDFGDGTQTSVDAAMDIAVIRELFGNLLKIAPESGGITPSEEAEYKRIIAGAPEYRLNEYGAPREWLDDDFPDNDLHRHQSHLYPMYPGLEKTRIDAETDAAYRMGGFRRMTVGLSCQTSWSLIQNANLMARVKDGELAYQSLNLISKTCLLRNLFTTHNDWRGSGVTLEFSIAPFQIDAVIGWASAVQEMLLFSSPERIDLLPALPAQWKEGCIGAMRTRCGAEVTISWTEKSINAEITALRDTEFDLYFPNGTKTRLMLSEGEQRTLTETM